MDENIIGGVGANIKPWTEDTKQYVEGRDEVATVEEVEISLYTKPIGTYAPPQIETVTLRSTSSQTTYNVRCLTRLHNFSSEATEDFEDWRNELNIKWEKLNRNTLWEKRLPFSNYDLVVKTSRVGVYSCDADIVFQSYDNPNRKYTGLYGRSDGLDSDPIFSFVENDKYIGYILYYMNIALNRITLYSVMMYKEDLTFVGDSVKIKVDAFDEQKGFPSTIGGFEGVGSAFNVVREAIQLPSAPTIGVSSSGLLNVYKIDNDGLNGFGAFLFQTDDGLGDYELTVPIAGATQDITNELLKCLNGTTSRIGTAFRQAVNGDLVQYVIDCHLLPFTPQIEQSTTNVKVGWKTYNTNANKVTNDYYDFNCGNLKIDSMYNSFLDMSAQIRLFIPFVGFVNLDPQDVMGKNINLTYRFNVIDGSFIAFVRVVLDNGALSIIGTYSGTSCVHMPLTGVNYSNIISGMMQTASSMGAKDPLGVIGGIQQTIGGSRVEQSNGYNASASFMGNRRPFVIIDYPVQQTPSNYYHTYGAPLFAKMKLNDLRGYCRCVNVDTSTMQIEARERDEIKRLLENGVYIK